MGDDQRADCVFRGDAAGIADHVGVSGTQAQAVLEQDAGIHAGEYRDMAARLDFKSPRSKLRAKTALAAKRSSATDKVLAPFRAWVFRLRSSAVEKTQRGNL